MNFFKNPCFACVCLCHEYDDAEYSSGSWELCGREFSDDYVNYLQSEESIFGIWAEKKKGFPFVEAPKKCIRKGYWEENKDFNFIFTGDYYGTLGSMMDMQIESKLAYEIAGSVANFNHKMRKARI